MIHKVAEYGSNLDPDPQHMSSVADPHLLLCGSGSGIHNTAHESLPDLIRVCIRIRPSVFKGNCRKKKTTNLTAEHGERLSRPGGPVGKHAAVVALEHGVNKILKDRKSGMLQQVIHDSTSTNSYNYSGLNYY